jgi:glycosyltransferase 2 family protein
MQHESRVTTPARAVASNLLSALSKRAWLIKLGASACLLWLVIRNTDASLAQLTISQPVYILFAALVFIAQPILNIPRWSIVLKMLGYAIPLRKLVSYFYIGLFFNQFLPASVGGDIIRVFYLSRHAVPWRHSISSVLLDRLVALGGLVVLYVALFNFASNEVVGHADAETIYYAFNVGIVVGLIAVVLVYGMAVLWTDSIRRLNWWGAEQIAELLRMLVRSVEVLGGRNLWTSISILGGLGMAVHVVEALGLLLVLKAFGYSIGFVNVAVIAALIIIVQSLPISLGGWGARELVAVDLLQRVGVAGNDAFFVSILLGMMFLLGGLPGVVFWLLTGGEIPRKGDDHKEEAKADQDAGSF